MLRRKAEGQLEDWLQAPTQKACLIKGARQVGKSYLALDFASSHFDNVVVFDLVDNAQARESFRQASSADDLMLRMSVAATTPMRAGNTAIIVDEVQECPNILTYLKPLVQRGEYRFILTGSLLGVKLQNIDSLPVGFLKQVEMFPLDFEEFCWAQGLSDQVLPMVWSLLMEEKSLPDFLYQRLLDLYHRYLMVGGMPDAVNSFVATNNIDQVRDVHANLHSLYREDITKYAPAELRLIIRQIYDLIPSEVVGRSRRFKLSDLKDVKRFSQVQEHFLWLAEAGVALPVYNVTVPASPLLMSEQRNLFKLFYLDAGMLASSYPKSAYGDILDGKPGMNMGGVYEGAVAQELRAHGFALRYYSSKKVGELDFVVEDMGGRVTAIEVKSGSNYVTHAALDNALATEGYGIDRAVVLAETNVRREGQILYVPIFLAGAWRYDS